MRVHLSKEPLNRFGGGVFVTRATSVDLQQATHLTNCTAYLRGGGLYYDDAQHLFGKSVECRCRHHTTVVACQTLINGALNEKRVIVNIATTTISHYYYHRDSHIFCNLR